MLGMALSIGASILGASQQKKNVEAQNEAIAQQYETNLAMTRATLDTLSERAGTAFTEVTRDKVRAQMAAEKAGIKAIGTKTVQAAALGTTGNRAEINTEAEVSREVGDAVTDADVNAEIEAWNLQNTIDDTGNKAIANLNNSIGSMSTGASTLENILGVGASALGAYQSMDKYQKADFKREFSFSSTSNPVSGYVKGVN